MFVETIDTGTKIFSKNSKYPKSFQLVCSVSGVNNLSGYVHKVSVKYFLFISKSVSVLLRMDIFVKYKNSDAVLSNRRISKETPEVVWFMKILKFIFTHCPFVACSIPDSTILLSLDSILTLYKISSEDVLVLVAYTKYDTSYSPK